MKTIDNTQRLKTYKIKNHDSGKTYNIKAVNYADAKMKYNKYILKDATVTYIENYKGVQIYQNDDDKKYSATVYTKSFEEKDLKNLKVKIDEAKNEHIKKYRNLDSDSHSLKTYKIKNNDSGKTYRVKATSYTDAKDKYNKHILKDAEKKYGVRATLGNNKGYFLGNYDRSWVSENSNAITKLSKEEAEQLAKQQLKKYGATVVQFTDSLTEDSSFDSLFQFVKELKEITFKSDEQVIRSAFLKAETIARQVESSIRGLSEQYKPKLANFKKDPDNNAVKKEYYKVARIVDYVRTSLLICVQFFKTRGGEINSVLSIWNSGRIVGERFEGKTDKYLSMAQKYHDRFLQLSKQLYALTTDSLTEDAAVIYGEWESDKKNGMWYVNTNDLQETKRELKSAGYKYESHSTNLKGMMYKYTVQYRKDSLTEDEIAGWIAIYNGTRIEIKKSEADSLYAAKKLAILKFKEKFKNVKEHMISIAPGYNDSITEDSDKSMGTYNGYSIKQNVDGDVYVLKKSGEKQFFESWKKAHEAIKTGAIKDSLTEDADIAQNDIKSSYLPEDANADNIQYLGFNEKRKLSFYGYGDRYFVHYDLEGRTEEIDKSTVQKILKKNILGEIDENDLINKEPQSEEIVSDTDEKVTKDSIVADKLIGNGEVHFRYKGGRVITGAWNKNKLNEREISSILNKYNCKREQASWNDIVFSTQIGNEENLCKAFNEINPSYSVSELLSLHDSINKGGDK